MPPTIIAETKEYLILNKPAGLVVHGDGRTAEKTLADWLVENYPDIKSVGEPWQDQKGNAIYRPGIVHRLDRETSGVMVIAKTQGMFDSLKSQFQNKEVEKIYHAFVYGMVKIGSVSGKASINRPIGKSTQDFRKWSAQRGAKGELRDAVTDYSVIKACNELSFVEASPKTGRTHQIRVHFKAINHPVICDKLYAPNHKPMLGFDRTALHARNITFTNLSAETVSYEAAYPGDFEKAIAQVGSLC